FSYAAHPTPAVPATSTASPTALHFSHSRRLRMPLGAPSVPLTSGSPPRVVRVTCSHDDAPGRAGTAAGSGPNGGRGRAPAGRQWVVAVTRVVSGSSPSPRRQWAVAVTRSLSTRLASDSSPSRSRCRHSTTDPPVASGAYNPASSPSQ